VPAEQRLWGHLSNRQLGGFKFVRQEAIGKYFADFACRELKLVVEVDGATHSAPDEIASDQARDAYLAEQGYRVIRVSNEEVRTNLSGVLDAIVAELNMRAETTTKQVAAPHPDPLPACGERG
jgi:very-short-patch-repair endonuclease